MIANTLFTLMLPVCCIYAAARGGAPERLVSAAFFLAAVGTALTGFGVSVDGQTWWGVFIVDIALLMALTSIALRANRLWTLSVCSLQLITVVAHFMNMILPGYRPWAYAASITLTSLLMPPILAFGTFCHRQRLSRTGADRSWRTSSNPSQMATPS